MRVDLWLCEPRSGGGRRRNECSSRPPGARLDRPRSTILPTSSLGRWAVGLSSGFFPLVFAATVVPRGALPYCLRRLGRSRRGCCDHSGPGARSRRVRRASTRCDRRCFRARRVDHGQPVGAFRVTRRATHPGIDLLPAMSSLRVSRSETRPSSGADPRQDAAHGPIIDASSRRARLDVLGVEES